MPPGSVLSPVGTPSPASVVVGPDGDAVLGPNGQVVTVPTGSTIGPDGTVTGPDGRPVLGPDGEPIKVPPGSVLTPIATGTPGLSDLRVPGAIMGDPNFGPVRVPVTQAAVPQLPLTRALPSAVPVASVGAGSTLAAGDLAIPAGLTAGLPSASLPRRRVGGSRAVPVRAADGWAAVPRESSPGSADPATRCGSRSPRSAAAPARAAPVRGAPTRPGLDPCAARR